MVGALFGCKMNAVNLFFKFPFLRVNAYEMGPVVLSHSKGKLNMLGSMFN